MKVTPEPVFVVGCPRSGTSVMSWAIAQHDGFATGPESHFLYYLCRLQPGRVAADPSRVHEAYRSSLTGDSWLDQNKVSFEEFAAAIGSGICELYATYSGGRRWVDSSPEHVLVMDVLVALFPKTKIVHMIRDARAVCKSMINSGFAAPWASDLDHACDTWNHYVRVGIESEDRLCGSVLRVHQESLLKDPDETTQRVFNFLGIERPTKVLEFLRRGPVNSSYDRRTQRGGTLAPDSDGSAYTEAGDQSLPKQPTAWNPEMESHVEAKCGELMRNLGYMLSA